MMYDCWHGPSHTRHQCAELESSTARRTTCSSVSQPRKHARHRKDLGRNTYFAGALNKVTLFAGQQGKLPVWARTPNTPHQVEQAAFRAAKLGRGIQIQNF